jgi:hypothetical protein
MGQISKEYYCDKMDFPDKNFEILYNFFVQKIHCLDELISYAHAY